MVKASSYSFVEMKKQEIESIVTDVFLSGDDSWLPLYIDAMLQSGIWGDSDVANLVSGFEERARDTEEFIRGFISPKKLQNESEAGTAPKKKKRKHKKTLTVPASTRFKPVQIGYGLESSIKLAPVRRADVKLDAHTTPREKPNSHILYAAGWVLKADDTDM